MGAATFIRRETIIWKEFFFPPGDGKSFAFVIKGETKKRFPIRGKPISRCHKELDRVKRASVMNQTASEVFFREVSHSPGPNEKFQLHKFSCSFRSQLELNFKGFFQKSSCCCGASFNPQLSVREAKCFWTLQSRQNLRSLFYYPATEKPTRLTTAAPAPSRSIHLSFPWDSMHETRIEFFILNFYSERAASCVVPALEIHNETRGRRRGRMEDGNVHNAERSY